MNLANENISPSTLSYLALQKSILFGSAKKSCRARSMGVNALISDIPHMCSLRPQLFPHMCINMENCFHKMDCTYFRLLAKAKVRKAEHALAKVQEFLNPAELPTDLETVIDEERFLFHNMGLKMRGFLLLGRRGVFDGTVENMHLHWKHRELVKIIAKGKTFGQVKHIVISLEAESGVVLISLDKTTKGYAIVIYRGKNYSRPHILRPKNLLTRKQALARSIELQRREALNHHISGLQKRIDMLKSHLDEVESGENLGNEHFNFKVRIHIETSGGSCPHYIFGHS